MNEPSLIDFLIHVNSNFPLINSFLFNITIFAAAHQLSNFKLKKSLKSKDYTGWIIDSRSLRNIRSVEELQRRVNFKSVSDLVPYIEKIRQYTKPDNMKTAYKNLASVISAKKTFNLLSLSTGTYEVANNKINYANESAIGHELLHMASSFYDKIKKIEYCGFSQCSNSKRIGMGLDEGYTELLASRIFNKKHKPEAYHRLVRLAHLFEFFFDNPKEMEDYYFNHDLPGFIRHMSKFASKDEIVDILSSMDIILAKHTIFPTTDEFKVKMKLYKMLKANCKERSKISAFEREIKKSPLIALILNGKKLVLQRDNPYLRVSQSEKRMK